MIDSEMTGGLVATKLYSTESQLNELFNEYLQDEAYREIINGQIKYCCIVYPARITPAEWKQIADMALYNSIRKYRNDCGASFNTYLYGQVRFEYRNYIRAFKAYPAEKSYSHKNPDENGKAVYHEKYDNIDLKDLLGSLDERSRKVVEMRFFEKLTLQEVSDIIGCSRERVRQIANEAVETMKENAIRANNRPSKHRVA